ncbi:MAG TPA: hypothetical protein VK595_11535 [Vicinamibacterales bacterium]|nr:hypothetical protein [Vicinamibacterales bacterium]
MGDDPIARLRAEMDQAREGMKEMAGSLWAFYSELTGQGFTSEQAFAMTLALMTNMIRSWSSGDDD